MNPRPAVLTVCTICHVDGGCTCFSRTPQPQPRRRHAEVSTPDSGHRRSRQRDDDDTIMKMVVGAAKAGDTGKQHKVSSARRHRLPHLADPSALTSDGTPVPNPLAPYEQA